STIKSTLRGRPSSPRSAIRSLIVLLPTSITPTVLGLELVSMRRDQNDKFTLFTGARHLSADDADGAAPDGFVPLCQFPADANHSIRAESRFEFRHHLIDAVTGFV